MIFFKIVNNLQLAMIYMILGFKAQIAYRWAFLIELSSSLFYDSIVVAFFMFFFNKITIPDGLLSSDFAVLWAVNAAGIGLARTFGGNCYNLANVITQGELDIWMIYPRPLLFHLLINRFRMVQSSWIVSSYLIFIVFAHPNIQQIFLFCILSFVSAAVHLGFQILINSLSFFIGDSSAIANYADSALISFTMYPTSFFTGVAKILFFTIIPTAFVGSLPLQAIISLDLRFALFTFLGAFGFLALGTIVFYTGLRHYQSGNILQMHG